MAVTIVQIGDSHSAQRYGAELHRLLTLAGGIVTSYAWPASSPLSWLLRYAPQAKAVAPLTTIAPDGASHVTPTESANALGNLPSLVTKHRPAIVVVSLGANMRWMKPAQVSHDAAAFAKAAVVGGARLFWVGPPPQGSDTADRSAYEDFDRRLAEAVAPYGQYVSSAPLVARYAGSDGVHFNTQAGQRIAKAWAKGVVAALVGTASTDAARPTTVARASTSRSAGGALVAGGLVLAALMVSASHRGRAARHT